MCDRYVYVYKCVWYVCICVHGMCGMYVVYVCMVCVHGMYVYVSTCVMCMYMCAWCVLYVCMVCVHACVCGVCV